MVNKARLRNLLDLHCKAHETLGRPCGDATRTPPPTDGTPHSKIVISPAPTNSIVAWRFYCSWLKKQVRDKTQWLLAELTQVLANRKWLNSPWEKSDDLTGIRTRISRQPAIPRKINFERWLLGDIPYLHESKKRFFSLSTPAEKWVRLTIGCKILYVDRVASFTPEKLWIRVCRMIAIQRKTNVKNIWTVI
jgi:hypothetical protein